MDVSFSRTVEKPLDGSEFECTISPLKADCALNEGQNGKSRWRYVGCPRNSPWLNDTQATDAGSANLNEMAGLQYPYLQGTQVADAGLAELKKMKGLKYLDLSYNVSP